MEQPEKEIKPGGVIELPLSPGSRENCRTIIRQSLFTAARAALLVDLLEQVEHPFVSGLEAISARLDQMYLHQQEEFKRG